MKKFVLVLMILATHILHPLNAQAEEAASSTQLSAVQQSATTSTVFQPSFFGSFRVAPTMKVDEASLRSRDSYEIGYSWSETGKVMFQHRFDHNLSNSAGAAGGLDLQSYQAFLRAKFKNVYKQGAWSLDIQPRFYLPSRADEREQGMLGALRTYFQVNRRLNPNFKLTASLIPIAYFHSQAADDTGAFANKEWEMRYRLEAAWNIRQDVLLWMPLKFKQRHYRNIADFGVNDNKYNYKLEFNPELLYFVNRNFTVGIAYETGNMIHSDLSGIDVVKGIKDGWAYAIFEAAI